MHILKIVIDCGCDFNKPNQLIISMRTTFLPFAVFFFHVAACKMLHSRYIIGVNTSCTRVRNYWKIMSLKTLQVFLINSDCTIVHNLLKYISHDEKKSKFLRRGKVNLFPIS